MDGESIFSQSSQLGLPISERPKDSSQYVTGEVAVRSLRPLLETRAEMLGIHLEGPCLSPQYSRAQPKHRLRGVDRRELASILAKGPMGSVRAFFSEDCGLITILRDTPQ